MQKPRRDSLGLGADNWFGPPSERCAPSRRLVRNDECAGIPSQTRYFRAPTWASPSARWRVCLQLSSARSCCASRSGGPLSLTLAARGRLRRRFPAFLAGSCKARLTFSIDDQSNSTTLLLVRTQTPISPPVCRVPSHQFPRATLPRLRPNTLGH